MPGARSWAERDAAVVWHGFTQMEGYTSSSPVIVERAEGHELVDVDGNRYLDAISSLWVNTLGHRVPELDAAVREQLGRVAHSTMLGNGNRVVIELAEALAAVVPVDEPHILFASDGASAVEQALKIAFQFWANQGVGGRTSYLTFGAAYHGDTLGALSLGDGGFGTDLFDPLRFPVRRSPGFSDPAWADVAVAMVAEHAATLAAVVVEPLVQGAGGMRMGGPGGLAALAAACREADVLLVLDEVATGFGRTGTLFAADQCGVRPDLLCLGKGLTAGYLPMSATVASGRVFDAFRGADLGPRSLYHGHSFGGNALGAAVALRHLELLADGKVLANVAARSAQLDQLLDERVAPRTDVADVRLCGLMGGVELLARGGVASGAAGRWVCRAAVERGVLLRPLGGVVVLMPPLTVTADEIDRIVAVLAASLDAVAATPPTRSGDTWVPSAASSATRTERAGEEMWAEWAAAELDGVRDSGRWRQPVDFDARSAPGTRGTLPDGREVVAFASNDYLGLSRHPAVVAAAHAALDRWGTGAGAARLVVGSRPVHAELEAALAEWKGTEAAVVFPTGFAANLGVLATFAGAGVRVLSDERNHASIIDGCRLARADVAVYRHGDADHVGSLLERSSGPTVVVTETIFSMDGDRAPVEALAELCARHGALLVLDEAHAVLDSGPGLDGVEHLRVGTLSKAVGSLGGFVAASRDFVDLLVNRARPFIFTTAPTPADTAAALAAVGVIRSSEGDRLRRRLRARVDQLAPGRPSPIVPVVLGDEGRALAAAAALLERGCLVPAIRPPTVAPGTCRLRVTLSAAHTEAEVAALAAALTDIAPWPTRPPSPTSPP